MCVVVVGMMVKIGLESHMLSFLLASCRKGVMYMYMLPMLPPPPDNNMHNYMHTPETRSPVQSQYLKCYTSAQHTQAVGTYALIDLILSTSR